MNLPLLLGSLAAILVLAAMAYGLGLGQRITLDHERAARTAEQAVSGFAAQSVALAFDGKGAVAIGQDGDVVLLKVVGARVAARHFSSLPQQRETAAGIEIDSGDRWFGRLVVARDAFSGVLENAAPR